MIPDPRVEPTLDVETGGRLCGLGRSKAYEQARRWLDTDGAEGLPCIAFGRTLRVPTAAVLRLLGLDGDNEQHASQNLSLDESEPPAGTEGSVIDLNAARHQIAHGPG